VTPRIQGIGLLFGLAFGFTLAAARLTEFDVIHRMLLFRDPAPFLIMGSAVVVAAPTLRLLHRLGWETPLGGKLTLSASPIERHHILGSLVFGTGWAVAGSCPGPALAMIGTGRVMGIAIVTGLFCGIALRDAVATQQTRQRVVAAVEPLGVGM